MLPRKRKTPEQGVSGPTASGPSGAPKDIFKDRSVKRAKVDHQPSQDGKLPRKRAKAAKKTTPGKIQNIVDVSSSPVPQTAGHITPIQAKSQLVDAAKGPISLTALVATCINNSDSTTPGSPSISEDTSDKPMTPAANNLPKKRSHPSKKVSENMETHDSDEDAVSVSSPAHPAADTESLLLPDPGFTNVVPEISEVKDVVTKLLTGKLQWPLNPTPTPPRDDVCPVDWEQAPFNIVERRYPQWKDAYMWRRPWTTNPPTFVDCGGMYLEEYNKAGAPKDYEETVRKQFMKMNLLVFLETGRYYAGSLSGLKNLVPEADDALKKQRKAEKKAAKKALAKGDNDGTGHDDIMERHVKTTWEKLLAYPCEEFTFRCVDNSDEERPREHYRYMPVDIIRLESDLLEPMIGEGVCQLDLEYDLDVVDGFMNCLWPFKHVVLPNILNCPVKHGGQRAWKVSRIVWTAGKTIQLYCLAKQLECSRICDMAVTQLYHMFKDEIQYRYEARTGMRKFGDIPKYFASVLDFEPKDINELWKFTDEDDPMRMLWLDIMNAKAYKGIMKLDEELDDYAPEIVGAVESKYWPKTTIGDLRERFMAGHGDVLEVPEPQLIRGEILPGYSARNYNALCGLKKEEFCDRYHDHVEVYLPCHLESTAPVIPEDNDLVIEDPCDNGKAYGYGDGHGVDDDEFL